MTLNAVIDYIQDLAHDLRGTKTVGHSLLLPFEGIPSKVDFQNTFADFSRILNDEIDWAFVSERSDVITSKKFDSDDASIAIVRSRGIINCPSSSVADMIWNVKRRASWDPLFETSELTKQINDEILVAYMVTKGSTLIWPRDFSVAISRKEDPKGTFYIVARSINEPKLIPTSVEGRVRGVMHLYGFKIEPITHSDYNGEACKVTSICQVDNSGWLLDELQSSMNSATESAIVGLRTSLVGDANGERMNELERDELKLLSVV